MSHIDEGVLRAYHDHELSASEQAHVTRHLAQCEGCATHAQRLAARAAWLDAHFTLPEQSAYPTPQQAYSRFVARRPSDPPLRTLEVNPMQRTAFWRRLPTVKVAALVATLLLVLTLTIGPLRTVAADFLRLFRVERVTVLPVELDNMDGARFDSLAQQAQLMAESFEIEIVGESQEVSNAAEATDRLGYPVRLPADQTVDALNIEAGVSMHGTLDEAQLESLFYYAFENKLDLPSSIDGKPFKVVVPPMVRAELGEGCGDYRERARNGCVTLVQLGSPIAEFPDELPVLRLGELFLQLVGYDSAEARELARTIDWTSTLVVPIPSRDMESQSVTVDGVEGTLLTSESDSAAFHQRYALIWVREGKLYGLAGHGDPAPAIAMANSLR